MAGSADEIVTSILGFALSTSKLSVGGISHAWGQFTIRSIFTRASRINFDPALMLS